MDKSFINSNENIPFSKIRGLDLQDLLVLASNYNLEYRQSLGLPEYETFGVEIEYEGLLKMITDKFVQKKLPNWDSKIDGSLINGGEVSSTILHDGIECWKELKLICDHLKKRGADTTHNAGGHIHIGAHILGNDIEAWRIFLKTYITYEHVLFRFLYGDKINARKGIYKHAAPIAEYLYSVLEEINKIKNVSDIRYILPLANRYVALNFQHVDFFEPTNVKYRNTYEFRSHNATDECIIWQNSINATCKMSLSSGQKLIDEEFLDYKLKKEYMNYSDNKYLYDYIDLKSVLEFVDLIFNNNLDKIYFLVQYLKKFQNGYGVKTTVKSKRFIRKVGD